MSESIAQPEAPDMEGPMKHKMARLADVARLAKVSTATVSRALSLPDKVKPETIQRVMSAVNKLGYVPHGSARALALRRTHTVGAVVPTLDNSVFGNTIHALQRTLDEAGYTLLLACDDFDPVVGLRVARKLVERGVDAVILFGTDHAPELYELMQQRGIPYILTWALDASARHPCIGFDSHRAGHELAEHLLGLGHSRFALISGLTAHNERHRQRVLGILEALSSWRVEVPPQRIVEKPFSLSAGREGLREVMAGENRPTAVICGNDVLAIGAIAECHAMGLDVPRDVSIAGFDDLEIGSVIQPALTTVHFPGWEMGLQAGAQILARLAGRPARDVVELPVRLVIRETTAAPGYSAGALAARGAAGTPLDFG